MLIALAVLAGLAVAAGIALVAWRVGHRGATVSRPVSQAPAQAIPAPRRSVAALPRPEVHLHFHGVTAEDAAAIVRRAIEDDPRT